MGSTQSTWGLRSSKMSAEEHTYKIVVVGAGAVGKSAITLRLCSGKYPKNYDPTIEDSYRKKLEVNDKVCTLDILDTAGQDEYRTLREEYMVEGRGFVLVYSIVDQDSFDKMDEFKCQIDKACAKTGVKVPIMLVGNKCDMTDERVIQERQGKSKVAEWIESKTSKSAIGEIVFHEASAKEDKNITQIFKDLVENMDAASAGGGSKPKKADSKGFGSDEKGDAPATKDEGSKGGGCKCS